MDRAATIAIIRAADAAAGEHSMDYESMTDAELTDIVNCFEPWEILEYAQSAPGVN